MFIWHLRGTLGIVCAIAFGVVWVAAFMCALVAETLVTSILAYVAATILSVLISFWMCRHREKLSFANTFSAEQAFPSSKQNARSVAVWHTAISLFFLVAVLYTVVPTEVALWSKQSLLVFAFYLFCLAGPIGLLHAIVRRWAL